VTSAPQQQQASFINTHQQKRPPFGFRSNARRRTTATALPIW